MKLDQDLAQEERVPSPGLEEEDVEAVMHLKTAVGRAFPWINAPAASICAVISIFGHRLPIPSTVLDSLPEQSQVLCWFSVSSGLIGSGQKLSGDIYAGSKKRDGTPRTMSLRKAFHDILVLKSSLARALFWVYYPTMILAGLFAILGAPACLPKHIMNSLPTWDTILSFWILSLFLVICSFDCEDEILAKEQGRTPKVESIVTVFSKPFYLKQPLGRVLLWCNFPPAFICLFCSLLDEALPLPKALLAYQPGLITSLLWLLVSIPLAVLAVVWEEDEGFRARARGMLGGLWRG